MAERRSSTDSILRDFSQDDIPSSLPQAPPSTPVLSYPSPTPVKPTPLTLKTRLLNLISPRNTDMNQLIRKLEVQFEELQREVLKYQFDKKSDKEPSQDPHHPVNSPRISHEVHFVGRSAIDTTIVTLSTFLIQHDMFGAITELWLNNNLISDSGAESLARYLEMPRCPLVEVWLGQNQIGPNGVALIAAALSSNTNSRLKCLGLDRNPIENGGAGCLAQMLRGNHTLITVDVHGCMINQTTNTVDDDDYEGYGCKVVKMPGGEYIATVVDSTEGGHVTDQRLLDAITTFSAFNKINPTREQTIKGLMLRTRRTKVATAKASQESGVTNANTEETAQESMVSSFLSELCNRPSNETLTNEEKRKWKDCEWERLYVEIERGRVARSVLADRLEIRQSDSIEKIGDDEDDGGDGEEEILGELGDEKEERLGRDLDDEVVRTEARTWRELKMGITGSSRVSHNNRSVTKKEITEGNNNANNAPPNSFREEDEQANAMQTVYDEEEKEGGAENIEASADVKFV